MTRVLTRRVLLVAFAALVPVGAHAQGVRCPAGTIPYADLQTQDSHGHKQDTLCIDALSGAVTGTSVWLAGAGAGAPAAATYITVDNTGPAPTNYQVLTAGANVTLTPNAAAHTLTVASTGSGGSSSGAAGSTQASDGAGGFRSNAFLKLDTTNGYSGTRNDSAVPLFPMDVSWTSLSRSTGPNNLAEFVGSWSTTPASPADVHMVNYTLSTSGTDAAFSDGTFAGYYLTLNDNRTPSGASTVGHELGTVSRFGFNGGANLTCTTCGAFYATADYGAASNGSSIAGYIEDGGSIHGTGNLGQWEAFSGGFPGITGGGVNNFTIFSAAMAGTISHGTGTGCVAAFAAGSGVCSGAGSQFAFFSDAAFPSALQNTLAVGQATACASTFCANGGIILGSTSGTQSDIQLNSKNNGSVAVTIKMPVAGSGITQHWAGDSGTFVMTTSNNDATGQTANYGPITLYNAGDTTARFFRVTIYTVCSTSVASSTVTVSVSYTDDVQAQTDSGAALSCATAGTHQSFSDSFFVGSGGHNVTFSAAVANAPHFNIHAVIEEINPTTN